MEHPPRLVRALQRRGLVLSPEAHKLHHTAPYDSHYCITNGWLNPLIERTGLFSRMINILKGAQTWWKGVRSQLSMES